jgi:hypothetical protein
MTDAAVDPILLSVFARAFKSVTDEMSISLQKTTRSPILCEAKDFVTGLYDAQGNMLEQTENLPILSFSLGPVCKYIVDYFGDDIHPGDVIFHNDVFSMGNQNNDVAVYKPIFFEGERVAWSACKGHQADIGGAVPGGYNPNATEVWQEALRIPPVKVYDRGTLRKDVWDLIFANIRFDIVQQDMRAEIGSCVVGERCLLRLLTKYGRECFERHKQALFAATRAMMEAEIAAIPNGEYRGESTIYYDGRNEGKQYRIRVKITVGDRKVTFDYGDTDPQSNAFVNGTYTSSASATILTFLGHGRAPGDPDSGGHDPQRGLSGGDDLRQPHLPGQRGLDRAGPGPRHAGSGDRGLEPPALLADHRAGPAEGRQVRGHLLHGAQGRLRRAARRGRVRSHRDDRRLRRGPRPGLRDVRAADAARAAQARVRVRLGGPGPVARRAGRRNHFRNRLGRHARGHLRRRRRRTGLRPARGR